jgi:molecular chaperone Hsp33
MRASVPAPGPVEMESFLCRRRDLVVARGCIDPLWAAWWQHAQQLQILPEQPAAMMMRDLLAAMVLYLALHPPDEFAACTLNIKEPKCNYFVCGDNNAFRVTGRVFEADVQAAAVNRFFFETQRPHLEAARTVLDVSGSSVLEMFEQYYWRSVQIPTRLLALEDGRHILIQGMPRADRQWIRELRVESVIEVLGELERIESRRYLFGCGCDPQRILSIVYGIFRNKKAELFHGQDRVEVSCPRCGKRYWITSEDFDRGPKGVGAA